MQIRERKIDYEVTVSEELRALIGARGSRPEVPVANVDQSTAHDEHVPEPDLIEVFSEIKLRTDGRRPVRLSGSKVLTVRVGDVPSAEGGTSLETRGSNSLTLFVTKNGDCVAHASIEPPSGSAARPVHRTGEVRSVSDLRRILSGCRPTFVGRATSAQECAPSDQNSQAQQVLADQFSELMQRLGPFLVTSRN